MVIKTIEQFTNFFHENYDVLLTKSKIITEWEDGFNDLLHDTFLIIYERMLSGVVDGFETTDGAIGYFYVCMRGKWRRMFWEKVKFYEFMDYDSPQADDDCDFTSHEIIKAINDEKNVRVKDVLQMVMAGYGTSEISEKYNISQVNTRYLIFKARRGFYERLYKQPYSQSPKKKLTLTNGTARYSLNRNEYPFEETMANKIRFVIKEDVEISHRDCLNKLRAYEGEIFNARNGFNSALQRLEQAGAVQRTKDGKMKLCA